MQHVDSNDRDIDVVALWLRYDPKRWMAGAIAGFFAGLCMAGFAMVLSKAFLGDLLYPIKIAALPFFGGEATDYAAPMRVLLTGFAFHSLLAVFWGVVFAHFAATNSMPGLLAMGLVWGAFCWVFITNLFSHSIPAVRAAHIPAGPAFFANQVYGLSLASVAFFERMLKR